MMWRIVLAAFLVTVADIGAPDAKENEPLTFSSGDHQVVLVELFTSEGCNSCPPADEWLAGLQHETGLWSEFIPVSFHVDYWDDIGWRDKFAKPEFSARQRRYADEGATNVVYTPGFFLSGREWRGWFQGRSLTTGASSVGNLSIRIEGQRISAHFDSEDDSNEELTIHVALLGMGLESRVSAGENIGRTLRHDFVAINATSAPLLKIGTTYTGRLGIPESHIRLERSAIVAWVSPRNRQLPIQSTGGLLR